MCEQKRHKWADVIHAYADGKQIQFTYKSSNELLWLDGDNLNGINNPNLEWRIKPEKKTYWMNIYRDNFGDLKTGNAVFNSQKVAECCINSEMSYIKTISFEVEE